MILHGTRGELMRLLRENWRNSIWNGMFVRLYIWISPLRSPPSNTKTRMLILAKSIRNDDTTISSVEWIRKLYHLLFARTRVRMREIDHWVSITWLNCTVIVSWVKHSNQRKEDSRMWWCTYRQGLTDTHRDQYQQFVDRTSKDNT